MLPFTHGGGGGGPSPANIQKWPSLTPEPRYSPLGHKYQEVSWNANTRQSYSETMIKGDKMKVIHNCFLGIERKITVPPQKITDIPFSWLK